MPSDSGSQEPRSRYVNWNDLKKQLAQMEREDQAARRGPMPLKLTPEEQDRIADGEPYCFRCGRPASSFSEYGDEWIDSETSFTSRADYVRQEEGTYNPDTNRFACDACYIAIGMPVGPILSEGWKAP